MVLNMLNVKVDFSDVKNINKVDFAQMVTLCKRPV
jgi:hypothetical protein